MVAVAAVASLVLAVPLVGQAERVVAGLVA